MLSVRGKVLPYSSDNDNSLALRLTLEDDEKITSPLQRSAGPTMANPERNYPSSVA